MADRRAAWAAGLLGFAFGGFLDGILLHQILQWHHLLSGWEGRATLAQLRFHMWWDGAFHAAHYLVLALGLVLLWGGGGTTRLRLGWFAIGFGAWHILDAVVNHWALGLHRIRQDSAQPLLWDLMFFGLGVLAVLLGLALRRRDAGGPAAAAALTALLLAAGAGAALPARGPALAALALPEGAGSEMALALAASAGADLAGADAAGQVWLLRTAEPLRLWHAAAAFGAVPVPLPPLPGCLTLPAG